ncbi:MAG: division/cell wall cluster transcriptional repressor MraZ [Anaerolineae bacterium]
MFLGSYKHNIDGKGRLTIPAKFRAELAQGLVITQGIEPCLVVYPMSEWTKLAGNINSLPFTQKEARDLRRLVFARANDTTPDRQGRVLVPTPLREYARLELDGDVIIAGMYSYLEIWNPQLWKEMRENLEENIYPEQWANLGV